MVFNLLAETLKTRDVEFGEAALLAFLGYAIVFFGIAFLIFVVWFVGKVMNKKNDAPAKKVEKPKAEETPIEMPHVAPQAEVDEETVAVIMAALMAYYQTNNPKCEFTVKRIKRI